MSEERPHCHHYSFAHLALRQVAFANPLACIGVLASPDRVKFLTDLWRSVDEHCRQRGEQSSINPAELVVHTTRVGEYPCAIVEMPEPWFVTGAYFVAVVLEVPVSKLGPDLKDPTAQYFTLERGESLDGAARTVLCAWTKEGSHVNYGNGPSPTLQDFVQAVRSHVEGKGGAAEGAGKPAE